jgi:transcriptional regulator with XRE-family HTH domain
VDQRYKDIGQRLKAYRLGTGLSAEQVADRLGVSRSAVYRIESGEVVKIETLERLADVLSTSVGSLLGVGVEYYAKAVAYFERMRQLEAEADLVIAHFAPVSYLLTTKRYHGHLRQMLVEALPAKAAAVPAALTEIETIMAILDERKTAARLRPPSIVNLVATREIERFLQLGLIGRFDLPAAEWERRRAAARAEVEHIARLMADEPMGVQLALIDDMLPNVTFQIFRTPAKTVLAVSPFRLGEQPNIRFGVATVTGAEEPVALYEGLVERLWQDALKGRQAAARLRDILARTGETARA